MSDTAIKIEGLKKKYRLGTIGGGTLQADIQSWWARKRGKEDPNSKVTDDVSKIGQEFYALNGINLEVKKGEALGIIGGNGAGKSTLLKILSRVTAPTEGEIGINGRIVSMLEVGTGFHAELTGRENIYMNGAILGMTKKEIDEKMDDIISFSECETFIDTPVKRYSSGMYVKLAFSVAAHLDAEIMIMDEVLAVGDIKFQKKCIEKMSEASNREGKTILYVSHNMNTIRQLCTRCIVLKKGKIVFDGNVEEAIRIYMDFDAFEAKGLYDLAETPRPSVIHGTKFRVLSFEFIGKENAVYCNNEKIKYRFSWEAYDGLEDLRVYFAIRDADTGQYVGMAQSDVFASPKAGDTGETTMEFDISNLVEGNYDFYVDVYGVYDYVNLYSFDHPDQKISFQIVQNPGETGLDWQKKYWGGIRLNQMRVVEE